MVWLTRNLPSLIALLIAAGLAWFVFWISYLVPERDQYLAHHPVVARAGETAAFGGADFTVISVDSSQTFPDGSDLPDGTTFVTAKVRLEGEGGEFYCDEYLTLDRITWPNAATTLSASFDDRLAGIDTSGCLWKNFLGGTTSSYHLATWGFLVPISAWEGAESAAVDVRMIGEYPEYLRLTINP